MHVMRAATRRASITRSLGWEGEFNPGESDCGKEEAETKATLSDVSEELSVEPSCHGFTMY